MEEHVREAEQRRRYGIASKLSWTALDVDPDRLLERDDVGGVRERGLDVLTARAAHDLVEAVESGEAGDLAGAGMGLCEPGAEHGSTLRLAKLARCG